jgi:uncharacterized protein YacL
MLTALDLRVVARLVMAATVFLLGLVAAALVVLTACRFMRTLLRALIGMLAALDLGFVAGLVVATSVLFSCHEKYSSGFDSGCRATFVNFHHLIKW